MGLYLHVPFCRRKCLYCDFCSYPDKENEIDAYVERLCEEITRRASCVRGRTVDTIYFGGGTPTLLSPTHVASLLEVIHAYYSLSNNVEITTECNPATADRTKLTALRGLGVNRLSVGAQSACDDELRALGRIHTFADTRQTVDAARAAGFDNLSLDVMYGIPGQTRKSFTHTLSELLRLDPEHISAYSLIVEPGTPFHERRSTLDLPDEDSVCDMTDDALTVLRTAGYERYEISNFARTGRVSRHNLHYWSMDDYLGFGPAAHSLVGMTRLQNRPDLAAYLAGQSIAEQEELLTPSTARDEYVMLRLRLADGVQKSAFDNRFGVSFDALYQATAAPYVDLGLMLDTPDRLCFTDRGFAVSNTVLSELLFRE